MKRRFVIRTQSDHEKTRINHEKQPLTAAIECGADIAATIVYMCVSGNSANRNKNLYFLYKKGFCKQCCVYVYNDNSVAHAYLYW